MIMVKPPIMLWIQNVHRQPKSWVMNPPAIGPIIGPSSVPLPQMLIGHPLSSGGYISAILAPPSIVGVEPPTPWKKRMMISVVTELAAPQPSVKAMKKKLETM